MQIDAIKLTDGVLRVKCSGTHGVGSEGNPSGLALTQAVERWISTHPQDTIDELEVDYTDVAYSWGDGPVSSVVPFVKRGITRIRLIAGAENRQALEALVSGCGMPWISVGSLDA